MAKQAAQGLIRVDYNGANLREFPVDKKAKIPALRLVPGGNNVSAAVVAALDAGKASKRGINRDWRKARDKGAIVVHSEEASKVLVNQPEGPDHPATLAEYSAEAADAIVRVTSDRGVLELWGQSEPRKTVQRAIQNRLVELGAALPTAG